MKQQQLGNFISKIPIAEAAPPQRNNKRMYICEVCHRDFHHKENFKEHKLVCYLIHSTKKDRNTQDDRCTDSTPPTHELYRIIKVLAEEVLTLKTELAKIKKYHPIAASQNKELMEYLVQHATPPQTYVEWLAETHIAPHHLQSTFDYSLTEGIIDILSESAAAATLPIRLFRHKRKIYVYSQDTAESEPQWSSTFTEVDFHKMIDVLCDRFLDAFIEWRMENAAQIEENETWRERDVVYSNKIILVSNEKIYPRIKRWLMQMTDDDYIARRSAAADDA